jgi:hypothetical protein
MTWLGEIVTYNLLIRVRRPHGTDFDGGDFSIACCVHPPGTRRKMVTVDRLDVAQAGFKSLGH